MKCNGIYIFKEVKKILFFNYNINYAISIIAVNT